MSNIDPKECRASSNGTESIPGWEGIPEAIVLNALIATLCLIFLSLVRIYYFKNKPYETDWCIKWYQFIFSDRNVVLLNSNSHINRLHPNAYLPPSLQEYSSMVTNKVQERTSGSSLYMTSNIGDKMKEKHQAKLDNVGKKRHWFLDYILIKDKDIYEHRGNDAFQYLLFQRYIIYFMTALTAVCMIILLPINIFGKNGGERYFEMTTINNIGEQNQIFWIHTIIAIAIVVLGLLMMKNFSDLIFTPTTEYDDRTILIQNIPESKRDARILKRYIEKRFIGVQVTQVLFTYSVEMLNDLKNQQATIEDALKYCHKYYESNGERLQIRKPGISGIVGMCVPCYTSKIDAITYYKEQQEEYQVLVLEEVSRLLSDPKHAVFVQLKDDNMAQRILEHFDNTHHERVMKSLIEAIKGCFCGLCCKQNNGNDPLCYNNWIVKAAPLPDDIEWRDIIMDTNTSGICTLILNIIVLVIFFFLTTPLILTNKLDQLLDRLDGMNNTLVSDIKGATNIQLTKYIGIIMLNTISIILPNLVMLIALRTPRNTKSEKYYKAMKSVYVFLILMVFIFPSIGLASLSVLIDNIFHKVVGENASNVSKNLFKCLFPAGSSAFFVQYVVASVFLNNPLDILRLSELTIYLINCIIYPQTEAEYYKARKETSFEFNYGSSYPRFLLIFTIVTTYSIACPIIAPFGLLYMLLKHLVDRYSIYYLYSTPVISPSIHQTAIIFVLISFFFMLFQLTAFLNVKINFDFDLKASNVCTLALMLYFILLCFICCNFSYFYPKESSLNRHRNSSAKKEVKSRAKEPNRT